MVSARCGAGWLDGLTLVLPICRVDRDGILRMTGARNNAKLLGCRRIGCVL